MASNHTFFIEMSLVCPRNKSTVAQYESRYAHVTDALVGRYKEQLTTHKSEFVCACGDAAHHTIELNAMNERTGDAMGQTLRDEKEVEVFFQDGFFEAVL